jgi:hypothetical protein
MYILNKERCNMLKKLIIADWLKIGPSLSYHILEDFDIIRYPEKNYSGLGF